MAKKPQTRTAGKRTTYNIANHHTAPIVIPQSSNGIITSRVKPLVLSPGESIPVEAEKWITIKKNPMVQTYIDAGLLSETAKPGSVTVSIEQSSSPQVPAHLAREEEVGNQTAVKASVRRKNASTVTID